MKKLNKTLTRALVILLSLVLLTSSVVSTTLAKYTVKKDVTTSVGLQKFGLKVDLEYEKKYKVTSSNKQGHTLEVTFEKITLIPGDDSFKDAITASISGTATVDADLNIEVIVTADDAKYTIPANTFDYYKNVDKVCIPMAFYVGDTQVTKSYTIASTGTGVVKKTAETGIGDAINEKVAAVLTGNNRVTHTANTGAVSTTIKPSDGNISIAGIGIGFVWENATGVTEGNTLKNDAPVNELGTWIADKEPTFTVTYKITLEQAPNT